MKKYAIVGILVGLMQIADAWHLATVMGLITSLGMVLSAIEFVWAITSLVVAIRTKHLPTRYLAGAFFLYNLAGWTVGMFLAPSESKAIPVWAIYAGGVFGLLYTSASAYVVLKSQVSAQGGSSRASSTTS